MNDTIFHSVIRVNGKNTCQLLDREPGTQETLNKRPQYGKELPTHYSHLLGSLLGLISSLVFLGKISEASALECPFSGEPRNLGANSLRSSQTPAPRMLEEALAPITHKVTVSRSTTSPKEPERSFKLRRGGGGAVLSLTETEEESVHTHSKNTEEAAGDEVGP